MIIDALLFSSLKHSSLPGRAIQAFIAFIEKQIGGTFVVDRGAFLEGDADLGELQGLAATLIRHKILTSYSPGTQLPDEPPVFIWSAQCNNKQQSMVGGMSLNNNYEALVAALAEGLERYLWFESKDYWKGVRRASTKELSSGEYIHIDRYASFSDTQRKESPKRAYSDTSTFTWIEGTSHTQKRPILIPAQTISGVIDPVLTEEPLIRQRTTIGLATWTSQVGALLSGALEIIERESFILSWFNRISPRRITPTQSILAAQPGLRQLLERGTRYCLKFHFLQLPTDAPTHVVCAIAEDTSGHKPRFTIGLKAHRSLGVCLEKACSEALRARTNFRLRASDPKQQTTTEPVVNQLNRVLYWTVPGRDTQLEFLLEGSETEVVVEPWEHDTIEEHWDRIVSWCARNHFECASVSLGVSKQNPTNLLVESVVIPELQPTHLAEDMMHLGGTRMKTMVESCGYRARETPFTELPHPMV